VLVTPARNEAALIELTLRSVVGQTIRPARWVVVSDGSTDATDEIVRRWAAEHPWIELVRMPERAERHFAGKAEAVRAGYARLRDVPHDAVACLDADVSFEEGYFAFLLGRLVEDPRLGVVGTPFVDRSAYDYRFVSLAHVSGACQLFRRECFEEIGGYRPIRNGGVDLAAVVTARMKGWKTRTFTGKACRHNRALGAARAGALRTRFQGGVQDHALGSHPLWEIARTAYQMTRRPVVAGGLMLLAGYLWSLARRAERPVSREFVEFRRREQMRRLRSVALGEIAGEDAPSSAPVCELEAVKVVARPWRGPHRVYGVFLVPDRCRGAGYSATVRVRDSRGEVFRSTVRHDRPDDADAGPGRYARRVYVPTRVGLWFLVTGRFRDLATPGGWLLSFVERAARRNADELPEAAGVEA
jgi:glycosyltransferase involved in cell wall biosynthesis